MKQKYQLKRIYYFIRIMQSSFQGNKLKRIYKLHHPNQFTNEITQIMKADFLKYAFEIDTNYNSKWACKFLRKFKDILI